MVREGPVTGGALPEPLSSEGEVGPGSPVGSEDTSDLSRHQELSGLGAQKCAQSKSGVGAEEEDA